MRARRRRLSALTFARFPRHRRAENAADESRDGARRGKGGYIVTLPLAGRVSRRESVFAFMCPRSRGFYGYSCANIPRAPRTVALIRFHGGDPRAFLVEYAPTEHELTQNIEGTESGLFDVSGISCLFPLRKGANDIPEKSKGEEEGAECRKCFAGISFYRQTRAYVQHSHGT